MTVSERAGISAKVQAGKEISSSPSRVMTIEIKARRSPRLIAATTPQPGEGYRTRGFFLSLKRGWPSLTRSPSATSIVGFIPI